MMEQGWERSWIWPGHECERQDLVRRRLVGPTDVPRPGQPLRQGKGTASEEAWLCPAAPRWALVEQMAMGLCNAIQPTWAQDEKGFQLVKEAQKSGILIPKSCPAPFSPEKHCPIICLVPPSGKGRSF